MGCKDFWLAEFGGIINWKSGGVPEFARSLCGDCEGSPTS
jgi:hypothetical protein